MATPQHRPLLRRIPGQDASDGAGVRLKRSIGSTPALRLDPFLMLDAFRTDNPDDYIAGFPAHPHRGFETVTYMLDGHMQHRLSNILGACPGIRSCPDMHRHLVPVTERGQKRQGQQRALAAGQPLAGPDRAPGAFGDEVDEGGVEGRRRPLAAVDVGVAQHAAAGGFSEGAAVSQGCAPR